MIHNSVKKQKTASLVPYIIVLFLVCMIVVGVFNFFNKEVEPSFSYEFNAPEKYSDSLFVRTLRGVLGVTPVNANDVRKKEEGDRIEYIDAYKNTDVVQIRETNKIKEDIILKEPGHPLKFEYRINVEDLEFEKMGNGDIIFYKKGHAGENLNRVFTIPAPFMVDANGESSEQGMVNYLKEGDEIPDAAYRHAVKTTITEDGILTLELYEKWLENAKYPIILDPTININIINIYSHPEQGEDWVVSFKTTGKADLRIIPDDQSTIDDDEFISLTCNGEMREPQILDGDVIYYKNWECDGVAKVVHYTLKEGHHTLRFEFGDQVLYAYNGDLNWGIMTTTSGSTTAVHSRAMGGMSPDLDNMTLKSISMYVGTTHSSQNRLAVYSGGNLATGPMGADLLYDFGTTSGTDTETWLTLTHPGGGVSLPKATSTWVAWKRNDAGFRVHYYTTASGDDYQSARGRWNSATVSTDETVAYPDPWPADAGGGFANYWYSIYITYSVPSSPVIGSVTASPGPTPVNATTTFSVDWWDNDGDGVKVYICNSDDISTTTPGCVGQTFCSFTSSYSTANPLTCEYKTSSTDIGSNTYYAFVCDDTVLCSNSVSGTFVVDYTSLSHWSFDDLEATSTVEDEGDLNNDGVNSGATWQNESMCVTGECFLFDGVDDVITVTQDASINLTTFPAYSISAWIKPNSDGENSTGEIIDKGTNTYLRVDSESGEYMDIEGKIDLTTADANLNISDAIKRNEWSHVAMVYADDADDEIEIYVNGHLAGTSSGGDGSLASDANNLLIGGDSSNNFHGSIDEVKVYPYALSATQIEYEYNSGLAGTKTPRGTGVSIGKKSDSWLSDGLVGYWKMDEISTSTAGAIDSSGNGNDGTYEATASTTEGKFGMGGVFDGTDDYIDIGDTSQNLNTISFWIKADSTTEDIIDLDGGTHTIEVSSGTLTATGFSSPIIYIDGEVSPTIDTSWHFVTIKTSTNIDVNNFDIGRVSTSYFDGKIDEVRIYNRVLSLGEIKDLYTWAPPPIVHYKFDEGSGSTIYNENYTNECTMQNMTDDNWKNGIYGNSLFFNTSGTDDYLDCGSSAPMDIDPEVMTVSAWVKPRAFGATQMVIGKNDLSATEFWWLTIKSLGYVNFNKNYTGTDLSVRSADNTLIAGKWQYITAVVDPAGSKIYINGVDSTSESTNPTGAHTEATLQMTVGGQTDDNFGFLGRIDDVRIYDYARTPRQIIEDMNGGHPIGGSPVGSQVGYWKFDKGYASTTYDTSINENDGTISGAFWSTAGKFGKAIEFDGVDDVVTITSNPSISIASSSTGYTLSAWVNADSDGENNVGEIFSKGTNNYLRVDSEAGNYLDIEGKIDLATIDANLNIDAGITLNNWHYVALVYKDDSDDEIKIYINGKLAGTSSGGDGSAVADSADLLIGGGTAANFDGEIDEVKIYNFPLTEDEILIDYNQGKSSVLGALSTESDGSTASFADSRKYCVPGDTSTCNAPVAEWNFDEGEGHTINDSSGNYRTGTFISTDVVDDVYWTTGKFGKSLNINDNGNTRGEEIVTATTSVDYSNGVTISSWIYPTNYDSSNYILVHRDSGGASAENDFYFARYSSIWRLSFYNGSGWDNANSSMMWELNKWSFISASYDGSNVLFCLNERCESVALSTSYGIVNSPFILGNHPTIDGYEWHGRLDQTRVYNYARTQAQLMWEYNRGMPVARWSFDEATSTIAHNEMYNQSHGTLTNMDETTDWVTGKFGSALDFDNVDDLVNVGSGDELDDLGQITITAWIKPDGWGENALGRITDKGQYKIFYLDDASDSLRFSQGHATNNGYWITATSSIELGVWQHVAVTYDDSSVNNDPTFYINGIEYNPIEHSIPSGTVDSDAGSDLIIGNNSGATATFDGAIDDVRVYNYILTDKQIEMVYNEGMGTSFR